MCGRHLGARNLLRVHRLRERVRDGPAGLDVAHDVNGRAVRRRAGVRLDGGRVLPGAGGGGSRTDGGGHRIAGVRCGGDGLGRGGGCLAGVDTRIVDTRIVLLPRLRYHRRVSMTATRFRG